MYPHIPWQIVVDPLGSADYTLEITALDYVVECTLAEVCSAPWLRFAVHPG